MTTGPAPEVVLDAPRGWVLLRHEGAVRGFKSALSFRRWCRSHGVTVLADGRKQWVRSADVDGALDAMAPPAPSPVVDIAELARQAVAARNRQAA